MLGIIGHLIGTAFRAFFKILLAAIVCGVIGVGVVLLLVYTNVTPWQWPPTPLTTVALVGVGALSAFAGGVATLMVEAVRALKEAATVVEKEAVAPIKAVEKEVGRL
jgi:hypothetical protein